MRRPALTGAVAGLAALLLHSPHVPALELRLDKRLSVAPAPARASDDAPLQPLIATVSVNGAEKGEHVLYLRGADDFLVARKVLGEWVRVPEDAPTRVVEGEPVVPLSAIRGSRVEFDEGALAVRLTFPPEAFAPQRFDYDPGRRAPLTPSSGPSALLTYRLGAARVPGSDATITNLNAETRLHWHDWLFADQHYATHGAAESGTQRGLTALVRDFPASLTRLTVGDAVTPLGDLSGGIVVGGVTYAKAYELDPYRIRQPTASFRTLVETPSQVDVYAGGNRIFRQVVAPGPLEVGNLTYLTGMRDLRIVVRDAFGRERTLDLPFYFGTRALAPGLQDFSYGAGVLREGLATRQDGYGRGAFSAMHRFGASENVTLGARAEGTRDFVTAGPGIVLRADRLGEAALELLATRSRGRADSGRAVSAAYAWIAGGLAFSLAARRTNGAFRVLQPPDSLGPSRADDNVAVSYSRERWGTLSVFAHRGVSRAFERTRSEGVGYAIPLRRDLSLQATWRRITGPVATREAFLNLQWVPAPDITTFASAHDISGTRGLTLQAGKLLPEGEGVAWRVAAGEDHGDSGRTRQLSPEVVWQARHATLEARADAGDIAGVRSHAYSAAASGSLAYVGGRVGLSRPIDDSFALVRLEPAVENVRVYLNRQELGRTNAGGEVFVPRVVSYVENHLAVDDRDIPIDRALDNKDRVLVPPAGRGDLVRFSAPPIRAVSGVLHLRRAGRDVPVELVLLTLHGPRGDFEMPVGRGGEFYVENLPAGRYRSRLEGATPCDFAFDVPDSPDPFVRLELAVPCDAP